MSAAALAVVVVAGPAPPTDAPAVPVDALNAQRIANAATARALARGRLLLAILTDALPAGAESFPPRG